MIQYIFNQSQNKSENFGIKKIKSRWYIKWNCKVHAKIIRMDQKNKKNKKGMQDLCHSKKRKKKECKTCAKKIEWGNLPIYVFLDLLRIFLEIFFRVLLCWWLFLPLNLNYKSSVIIRSLITQCSTYLKCFHVLYVL